MITGTTLLSITFIFFGLVILYCIIYCISEFIKLEFMVRDRRDGKYYWKSTWKKMYKDNPYLLEWAKY